jgi:NADPH:quinone reductase-like Zn-dependent oxidoreductase
VVVHFESGCRADRKEQHPELWGYSISNCKFINVGFSCYSSGRPIPHIGAIVIWSLLGLKLITDDVCDHSAGYTPIATCSPSNFEYVKSLGAKEVFKYKDPACADNIRQFTRNNLKLIWDCISSKESAKLCASVFAPIGAQGLRCVGLNPERIPRSDVKWSYTMVYTVFNEKWDVGFLRGTPDEARFRFALDFIRITKDLLVSGELRPHRVDVREGGLDGLLDGLHDLRNNVVSGKKIVYQLL